MKQSTPTPSPDTQSPLAAAASKRPGAVFLRADLQVHTPTDSRFEPRPEQMDRAARRTLARDYLWKAKERGIDLVGITEHNDVSWIDELRAAAKNIGLHLLPGFEVESAEGVHILCLFDPDVEISHLEDTLSRLGLTKAKREASRHELRTEQYFAEVLELVQRKECGGVCIAAHIESNKGLLAALREGARVDAWKKEALLAAQLARPPEGITSGNGRIIRGEDPNYARARLPAYLLTSDCRSLETIGTTSTWIKMDVVGVGGLRQAFLDPESRIAYSDPAEGREGGRLVAASWEGDFLDRLQFPLNTELNCLIGGKGTGKSTVIESIRYAFDLDYRTNEVGRAAKELREHAFRSGSKVSVVIETAPPAPTRYVVERTAPNAPVVRDVDGMARPDLDPKTLLRPCIYGQKEIFGIAQNARARLEMLDGFATDELRGTVEREQGLLQRCTDNASLILRTRTRIEESQQRLAELPNLEEWRDRFRQAGFDDLLRERRQLDREGLLLERAEAALLERRDALEGLDLPTGGLTSVLDVDNDEELPNPALIERARHSLQAFDARSQQQLEELALALTAARADFEAIRSEWSQLREERAADFDSALRQLQEKMPDVDPARYLDVERRIEQLKPLRITVGEAEKRLKEAREERARLVVDLMDVRGEKHRVRRRAADRLNSALAGHVEIELTNQADREGFIDRLSELKSGTRNDALRRMVEDPSFSPAMFAAAVRTGALSDRFPITAGQALNLERVLDEETLLALELAELPDEVRLKLDVSVGAEGHDYRELNRLSPGQKSTAILLLVMQESKDPLVIDQPEDDLDNRFIYDDIVKRLKKAKPARQFLIATHNANIPVLGDAEQIVALDAAEPAAGGRVSAFIRACGSIDAEDVRTAAEHILEGGEEAFALREAKYRG